MNGSGPFDLSGRVALVTGGNSGIGLGMARALARAGADLAVWGTDETRNAAAADELLSLGIKAAAFRCDVGDPRQVTEAFAATLGAFGRVDACFANAGIGGSGAPFLDQSYEEWRRVTRVDLDGVFLTLQAAGRHMVERGKGGSLVAVSSLIGPTGGYPTTQAYAASKSGVLGMVRSIAVELGRHGVRANTLIPGWVETPMADDLLAWEKFARRTKGRTPLKRYGTPEDIGGIAVYLAADASRFHTGDEIALDGGYRIG
ncbi:SDR family NAD(P)-dependent oxidoreductase [Streptomyces sp. NPDC088747]|uniref:SDR family NAD(P)-dependent oxidoreductase n=1 Tax=Streptomyces sp. NPDC088747 TaxID=3365886 RepID=UPI00380A1CD7